MKVAEIEYKRKHVIDQLHQLGIKDTDGLEYHELVRKLAIARASEVDVTCDSNKWF
ncbi:hypothetical protein [Halobacillus aidingensis]|uniref:Uncharacterized protein n=1 Tax=Halobacillus aidingensis TaxID=240303 RepID=A0A1H0MI42_HALAD|nr:hypothetical protein [Halobacillus aidingensis]SDO79985.1 hypothetical protein SAMN05421677_10843 [Halobacillus aidingensis]